MVCSECILKQKCYYVPLEKFEEGCVYPPCVHISDEHNKIISDKIDKAIKEYPY